MVAAIPSVQDYANQARSQDQQLMLRDLAIQKQQNSLKDAARAGATVSQAWQGAGTPEQKMQRSVDALNRQGLFTQAAGVQKELDASKASDATAAYRKAVTAGIAVTTLEKTMNLVSGILPATPSAANWEAAKATAKSMGLNDPMLDEPYSKETYMAAYNSIARLKAMLPVMKVRVQQKQREAEMAQQKYLAEERLAEEKRRTDILAKNEQARTAAMLERAKATHNANLIYRETPTNTDIANTDGFLKNTPMGKDLIRVTGEDSAGRTTYPAYEQALNWMAATAKKLMVDKNQSWNQSLEDAYTQAQQHYKQSTGPFYWKHKAQFDPRQDFGQPTAPEAPTKKEETPPVPGARKAPDGNWYIEKDGKYYKVD